eukprot:TRINITY_DN7018_c2_g1_i1.p1 TRINITY_DN7018_c2_g1~~TRINITY_DN7018_c2_g1_i1.p1  ORF type:complete len:750 (+),score=91.61 TRINITY_DN7018_c2_g1_i1:118-2367(+)
MLTETRPRTTAVEIEVESSSTCSDTDGIYETRLRPRGGAVPVDGRSCALQICEDANVSYSTPFSRVRFSEGSAGEVVENFFTSDVHLCACTPSVSVNSSFASAAPGVALTPPLSYRNDPQPNESDASSMSIVIEKPAGDELALLFSESDLVVQSTTDSALQPVVGKRLTHVGGHPMMTPQDVSSSARGATVLTLRFKDEIHTPDYSGWLEKKGASGLIKLYRRRWCEIYKQYLYYGVAMGEQCVGKIDLANAEVEVCESGDRLHAFTISGRHLPRTYELATETEGERNAWIRAITKTINKYEAAGAEEMEDWLTGLLPSAKGLTLNDFNLHRVVGKGTFAKVLKCTLKQPISQNQERREWLCKGLTEFYQHYRPERVSGVSTIITHSTGQEEHLHKQLLGRYPHASHDLEWLLHPPKVQAVAEAIFAMKIVKKAALPSIRIARMMMEEKAILQSMKHPYIVRLHYAFQNKAKLYLVMTYLSGGDLRTHLSKQRKFPESRAKFYCCQILLALDHLHAHGIVYRDLKPQNVVLDRDGHAVLTDLGLATDITQSGRAYTFCGTPQYVAPEVLQGSGYTKSVDFWALGIMAFEMLVGVTPFQAGDSMREMFVRIMEDDIRFPAVVSKNAREFINFTLERDPAHRLNTIATAKQLKFFKGTAWSDLLSRKIAAPYIPETDFCNNSKERPLTDLLFDGSPEGSVEGFEGSVNQELEDQFEGFTFLQGMPQRASERRCRQPAVKHTDPLAGIPTAT